MDGYWVWCGAVVCGEDGRYHMFASRWPNCRPMAGGYAVSSEIVRAVADTPEGPYVFEEVALPVRGEQFWDGRMTHNPSIHKCGDTYLLFYIGSTFDGPMPPPEAWVKRDGVEPDWDRADYDNPPQVRHAYANIRIGLATSPSVYGPWRRRDAPILQPRPGKWDSTVVTNPAPCVLDDGRIYMLYRSNTPNGLRIGAAMAEHFDAPFERLSDEPVLRLAGGQHVEDPFVWWTGDHFEMLAKDLDGSITGQKHAGIHATSPDGLTWTLSNPPLAFSRHVRWSDGTQTLRGSLERPFLLFADGRPTHLFAATADGPGGFHRARRTWNMVIPLAPS